MKRNPAYLGAVDALADAFDDLRDHQLAMLTGMRGAFEAIRAEFDPDGTRLKMTKERGNAFARFEEEFARAYEVQFQKLRVQRRARGEEAPHAPATPIPAGYDPLSLSEDAIAPPEADPHVRTDDPTSRELDGSAGPLKKGVVGRAADVTATVVSAMAGALGFPRRPSWAEWKDSGGHGRPHGDTRRGRHTLSAAAPQTTSVVSKRPGTLLCRAGCRVRLHGERLRMSERQSTPGPCESSTQRRRKRHLLRRSSTVAWEFQTFKPLFDY